MMPVRFSGPGGSLIRTCILDTGADDTVLPDWIAAAIEVDLTRAAEHRIGLAGRSPLTCRYLAVEMTISDGVQETYRWAPVVGFIDTQALPRPLLGYAGFLQYFDADFRGADLEVILTANRSFPGTRA